MINEVKSKVGAPSLTTSTSSTPQQSGNIYGRCRRYFVEPGDGYGYVGPFSTFGAALASIKEIAEDDDPPSICRRSIDDHPHAATIVADLSRRLEIIDVRAKGGPDACLRNDWGGDLPTHGENMV